MPKRMAFLNSEIPFPPMRLNPGSCNAVRIEAAMSHPVYRVKVTPEWIAENEAKLQASAEKFRARQRELGIIQT
jgi:hypothetical protein